MTLLRKMEYNVSLIFSKKWTMTPGMLCNDDVEVTSMFFFS